MAMAVTAAVATVAEGQYRDGSLGLRSTPQGPWLTRAVTRQPWLADTPARGLHVLSGQLGFSGGAGRTCLGCYTSVPDE